MPPNQVYDHIKFLARCQRRPFIVRNNQGDEEKVGAREKLTLFVRAYVTVMEFS